MLPETPGNERGFQDQVAPAGEVTQGGGGGGMVLFSGDKSSAMCCALCFALLDLGRGLFAAVVGADIHGPRATADSDGAVEIASSASLAPGHLTHSFVDAPATATSSSIPSATSGAPEELGLHL
jgi:hypothetical protein